MKTYHKTKDRREFFKQKFIEQGGCCLICGEDERLVIDHNHTTGALRGLLCYTHNAGLGMFQDRPDLLEKAANYLREYGYEGLPPEPEVDKRLVPIEHLELAYKLIMDPCFSSDRARGRELSKLVNITEGAGQARIKRLRQRVRQGEAPFKIAKDFE